MAAGATDKLWEIADVVGLVAAKQAKKPMVRGAYKMREKAAIA
ncbi:hypothetical protein MJ8_13450 [Mesorhizobium sp. J8]|nr:hypothetical protein MJ8_13450 [Mesorhizobium sp. J8]